MLSRRNALVNGRRSPQRRHRARLSPYRCAQVLWPTSPKTITSTQHIASPRRFIGTKSTRSKQIPVETNDVGCSRPSHWLLSILGITAFSSVVTKQQHAHAEGFTKTPLTQEIPYIQKTDPTTRDQFLISSSAVRGDRSKMEDTSYISNCKRFFAVYDGHGGAQVSEFLKNELYTRLLPTLSQLDMEVTNKPLITTASQKDTIEMMLRDAMATVDTDVLAKLEWKFQGSTAVGVLLYGDSIFSFNVGDSRAVLSRGGQTIELTRDHKPNDPVEKERIEKLGGSVVWCGYVDAQGEPLEPYGAYRVNGNLAVARAIGDRDMRPCVTGEAEIKHFEREIENDEFIVIASDGLWDVFTSEEAVSFVHDVLNGEVGGRESWRSGGHNDTSVPIFEWTHQFKSDRGMIKAARTRRKMQIATYLVEEALYRKTSDNVSVIVIWLK